MNSFHPKYWRIKASEVGFTLIELILVTVLLGFMISILYGTLNGIMQAKNTIASQRTVYRTARHVIGRINKELSSRVSEQIIEVEETEESSSSSPYTRRKVLVGKTGQSGNSDTDVITFVSDGASQEFFGSGGNKGRVQIQYRLEKDEERVQVDRYDDGFKSFVLVRDEVPAGLPDKKLAVDQRVVFPLAHDVASLNFRYMKDGTWKEEWSDRDRGFPEAVEITLKLRGESGRVEAFQTAVALQRRRGRRSRTPYDQLTP